MKLFSSFFKEPLLLWIVIPLSLFMVFGISNKSVELLSPQESIQTLQDIVTPLLWSQQSQTTKLYAWWDIMLSRGIGYYNKRNNWTEMFSWSAYNPIRDWCQYDCLLVFNLESLFSKTPNDAPESTFHFAANTRNIDILHRMKMNNPLYLSIANNHTRNVGKSGVMFTRDFLDQEGIAYGWAGEELSSYGYNVTKMMRDGIVICLSSYSYDGGMLWRWAQQYEIAKIDVWQLSRDVSVMDDMDCDVKIANLHRGREYDIAPTPDQRILAHEIIDLWFDLILGNHSHVPGLIETYRDKYIVYSMGNHIFDQDRGYKNCEKWKYDTIYDYQLDRCTVPTYIGMNLWFTFTKQDNLTSITLDHINFFGIKRWIQYQLDERTKEELKRELVRS